MVAPREPCRESRGAEERRAEARQWTITVWNTAYRYPGIDVLADPLPSRDEIRIALDDASDLLNELDALTALPAVKDDASPSGDDAHQPT
jgi:hypothetical protein